MLGASNTGITTRNNKDLYNSIQHLYEYARKSVPQNILTVHFRYATSKLQPLYFNYFINVHFIILLFGKITKL
jgi:hypothetical protein